jgi:SpoIID/LytB domain protein
MHPAPSSTIRALRAIVAAIVLATGLVALTASPAAAADTEMTFDGRGYGHGRGMSQYGAQGYATNHGWSSAQILNHYYGGTTAGLASSATTTTANPDPSSMQIRLQRMAGQQLRVTLSGGSLTLSGGNKVLPAGTKTIFLNRIVVNGTAVYEVWYSSTASCTAGLTPLGNTGASKLTIGKSVTDAEDPTKLIRVCPAGGSSSIWYPGRIQGEIVSGTSQTDNITTIEKQLRSVVPNESPASWSAAALQSQAVAARSYALAGDTRWPGADTCDTIYCQVYYGWYRDLGNGAAKSTATSTDSAIAATAGVVRLTSTNRIARTEFSSTSGGWTAGGTFPAVEDKGDVISPLHTWNRRVKVTALETAYGSGGKLESIQVTKRNGLGAGGGRVLEAKLTFSNGVTKTTTGNDIRSKLGLLSDWFFPACGVEAKYLDAVFQLFVKRDPGTNEIRDWCPLVRNGSERQRLTNALAVSDEWAGTQIRALYDKILDRQPDADGYAYWMERVRNGYRIEDIAAYFYGGSEYYASSGGTNRGFVKNLYQDLLGRPADEPGVQYWLDRMAAGMSRSDVAASFYASIESRESRVKDLYQTILGRNPDAAGLDYWSKQLLTLGDVSLAAYLGASKEFFDRSIG